MVSPLLRGHRQCRGAWILLRQRYPVTPTRVCRSLRCWHHSAVNSSLSEKKDINSGSQERGNIFYTTETVVFSPRKARKTWRVWLNMCTFSHWVVYIYKNATSRQALSILCWLIQNIMKNHFKLGHEDLLALPVFYIPQRYQPLGHVHTSEKREAVNSLVELKHC